MTARRYIDLCVPAEELGISVPRLRRMSEAGRFPDVLYADFGEYRIDAAAYEAWKQSRMLSSIVARAELTRERVRSGDA